MTLLFSGPKIIRFGGPHGCEFPANVRLILAFLQSLFPLVSCGQQAAASSSGTLQLTLKQAVQLALQQNPQRVIGRLLVFESDRNVQIARSPLLPQADIGASGSLNQYNFQSIDHVLLCPSARKHFCA